MAAVGDQFLRTQLELRRQKLEEAISGAPKDAPLMHLLEQVDAALERMDQGTFGICEECHEAIEQERLIADPLVRFCLDHLKPDQRRALEQDLELASRIQRALLPRPGLRLDGWEVHYHYEPLGMVSGDYCDVIAPENARGEFVFLVGDVAGKGVAAALLMTHLHAMFRSLATVGLPLDQMLALANRVFCESTMAGQYATLICGRAGREGAIEIASAGHLPALVACRGGITKLESTAVPLGMFCAGEYPVQKTKLEPGETLFLYTDGLSETRDSAGAEYGIARLAEFLAQRRTLAPDALLAACRNEIAAFSSGARRADDLTVMAIRRAS